MNLVFSKSKEGTVHIANPIIANPIIANPISMNITKPQITKCGRCRGAK